MLLFGIGTKTILPIPPPPYGPPFPGNHPAWLFGIQVYQSDQPAAGFFVPGACDAHGNCGIFTGFAGCGADLGCGFLLPTGYIMGGNGDPISITISDSYRYLAFVTDIETDIPFDLQLTADVPDGLVVRPLFVSFGEVTPFPAALPLFATGLGALGLLGWRRKRKTAAIAA